jgi:hypothetical protein
MARPVPLLRGAGTVPHTSLTAQRGVKQNFSACATTRRGVARAKRVLGCPDSPPWTARPTPAVKLPTGAPGPRGLVRRWAKRPR